MSRGRPGGEMPVVEMFMRRGLECEGAVLGVLGRRAARIVLEASQQMALSWIPMGARGLGCR